MDEFVRCPQCDDDLPGEEWERHLGTHGYFKRPDVAPPKVPWKDVMKQDEIIEIDENGKVHLPPPSDAAPEPNIVREALYAAHEAIETAVLHEDGLDGAEGDKVMHQIREALVEQLASSDAAQPVAWRWYFKGQTGGWHYTERAPTEDRRQPIIVEPLFAHPEDAPGGPWETRVLAAADALIAEDYDEAYHQLYALVEPTFTKQGCPFERLRVRLKGDEK